VNNSAIHSSSHIVWCEIWPLAWQKRFFCHKIPFILHLVCHTIAKCQFPHWKNNSNFTCVQSFNLLRNISPQSGQESSANKTNLQREEGSRERDEQHKTAYNGLDLWVAAFVSMGRALGRSAVYCKSCWWVQCRWGCRQTSSSKLLVVVLPIPHVVVVELLSLWSRKELHPAQGNCTCCRDDDNIPSQKPWQLLSPSSYSSTPEEHPK
jgi:hypothetical protein